MDLQTFLGLNLREILLLFFGFWVGVSTRIGGYIANLFIKSIKYYFKRKARAEKKARRKRKKQAFKQWRVQT